MLPVLAAALPAVGMVASALMQKKVNDDNQRFAHDAQTYQSAREDDAMQRRVADLRAAGINPILAAGTPGAASSAQGQATQVAPEADLGSAVNSALQARALRKDIEVAEEQKDALASQERLNNQQASKSFMEMQKVATEKRILDSQEGAVSAEAVARQATAAFDTDKAQLDRKLLKVDATLDRVGKALGVGSSAVGIGRASGAAKGVKNYLENKALEKAGSKGIPVKGRR